ncbi:MAG: VOC family protein [Planctomycetia bacterium]|nr:VOC family protein [Planctomycetia bacterium]
MSVSHNPVGWFEIPVADMDRAVKFYTQALGFELRVQDMFGAKMAFFPMGDCTSPGISGTLFQAPEIKPSLDGTTIYFHFPSLEPVIKTVEKAGGKIVVPRTSIGEFGFMAKFEDSEGNRIGLHEPPAGAPPTK